MIFEKVCWTRDSFSSWVGGLGLVVFQALGIWKKSEICHFGLYKGPKGLTDAFYGCERVEQIIYSLLSFINILKILLSPPRGWGGKPLRVWNPDPVKDYKTPKIHTVKFQKLAPGLIFFKGPFWGAYFWWGLYSEGLIYGGNFAFQNRLG